ncbi:MAG: glycosyltransferase, partial [Methanotrichaceae archaeon]|nr:glycosyltransferase [Methanotrichaceae archaeon]
ISVLSEEMSQLQNGISDRDGKISVLSEEMSQLQNGISDRDGKISVLSEEMSQLQNGISDRDGKISVLSAQLEHSNKQVAASSNEIMEMHKSIVWQMLMWYHYQVVERILPNGSHRRRRYDRLLNRCRSMISEGGIFSSAAKKSSSEEIPFAKQGPLVLMLDANIHNHFNPNVPLHLNEDLSARFTFPVNNLSEIRILTGTYERLNSDMIFSIMEEGNKRSPLRTSMVRGKDILNNDYTPFSFKPIKDSSGKTFIFNLRSKGEPAAAVWYNSETNLQDVQIFKSGNKISGLIGFQAFASSNIAYPYNYHLWILKNEPNEAELEHIKRSCHSLEYRPKISVVVPVWNTDERWLRFAIESVLNQIYDNWELCIANGGSTKQHVKGILDEFANRDSRIKVRHLKDNKGIAGNSNEALSMATGEFVGFLDHDDELATIAIFEIVKLLNHNNMLDFIYTDEDKIDENGNRNLPFFKPDWSPDIFLSNNYVCHFSVIRKSLLDKVGGFNEGYDGSQDYDLFLRVTEQTSKERIAHIPSICYHWRTASDSVASSREAKPYAYIAGEKALRDTMARRKIEIDGLFSGLVPKSYRIKYKIIDNPKVSIIIPTKDKVDVLKTCIDSIINKTLYDNYEIFIVDNGSKEDRTLTYYDKLRENPKINILYFNKPFNFSAINNYAVSKVNSEYILLLNSDIEVITPEWVNSMLELAQRSDVGAVGARLLYPNNTIQHAGVILVGGVAGHAHKHLPASEWGYFGRAQLIQNFSAVTAACLLTKKSIYNKVGGLNERNLAIAFNDVDYCLKLRQKGYLVIYTPYATLYHHESLFRGHEDTPEKQIRFAKEIKYMRDKWAEILDNDPYYNRNLTRDKEDFSIRI